MHHRFLVALLAASGSLLVGWTAKGAAPPCQRIADRRGSVIDRAILKDHEVQPTAGGLRALLKRLDSDLSEAEVRRLIQDLGDDAFERRERATARLTALPVPPLAALKEALTSPDAEVRQRSRRILAILERRTPPAMLLFAALRTIRDQAMPGLTAEVLKVAPRCETVTVLLAAREAMQATVRPADVGKLRAALASDSAAVRTLALAGLCALPTGASGPERRRAESLTSTTDVVRFVLAMDGVTRHDRDALRMLADLLASKHLDVRRRSVEVLRAVTGTTFGFDPEGPQENRQRATARWQTWIRQKGVTLRKSVPSRITWHDFLDTYRVVGQYDGERTEFVREVPAALEAYFRRESRTAGTIDAVVNRHRTAPWLYPIRGKNEVPRILAEKGSRYYPIWGTWRQRWSQWQVLDENGVAIQGKPVRGPHWESMLEFLVVPVTD